MCRYLTTSYRSSSHNVDFDILSRSPEVIDPYFLFLDDIYVSMSFPKPRPPLGSCVTLSGTFLQGYFTDSIQTLHDNSLVQYAVQKGRWLTLTYFSRSQRSNFDLFMFFAYFVKVYRLDSSKLCTYTVYTRKCLILTYML